MSSIPVSKNGEDNRMTISYTQISVKGENDRGYIPCQVEIENGFLTFQKRGLVAGTARGLVGLVASEHARKTNEVVRIPLSDITSVEPKATGFTKLVTIRATGFPVYTFGCSSKKEVEAIAALLRGK